VLSQNATSFELPLVPSRVIEKIVDYAYLRAGVNLDDADPFEIYVTADYFGMTGLMKYCEDTLIHSLVPDNCLKYWLFAR